MTNHVPAPTQPELEKIGTFLITRPCFTETKLYSKVVSGKKVWPALRYNSSVGAGIFPPLNRELSFFATSMRAALEQSSFIATWDPKVLPEELVLLNSLNQVKRTISATNLDPVSYPELFAAQDDWLSTLNGKSVLVVSPFAASVERQVPKLSRIHSTFVMPSMDVGTWSPPVSNGLNIWGDSFSTRMLRAQRELDTILLSHHYDVALISAGAYGPLVAAYLFEKGVSSVHVGGCLQLLFGIMGGRWRQSKNVMKAVNHHWLESPLERPPRGARLIEGSTYW